MNTCCGIRFIGLLLLAFLLFIGPAQGAEKGVVIKLATLPPEGNSWVKMLHALNTEVMKKTENKVQFKISVRTLLPN